MENKVSGFLVKDITDHLPVFAIYDCNHKLMEKSNISCKQIRTEEALNKFIADLMAHDWSDVLQAEGVNTAYDTFLDTFLVLYNKNCPVRQCRRINSSSTKPWYFKCLQEKEQYV